MESTNNHTLTITKDNYIKYVYKDKRFMWSDREVAMVFPKQIKRLCQIAPEFTHKAIFRLVPATKTDQEAFAFNGFAKLLVYETDYFYDGRGSCKLRFCDTWFGFDGCKFGDCDSIEIDLASFGIKKASEARIIKSCAIGSCI